MYPHVITILLFIMFAGGVGLTRATYIIGLANRYIESGERATILSSIAMLRRFALILLNPLVGFMADHSLRLALLLVGLLPIGALIVSTKDAKGAKI